MEENKINQENLSKLLTRTRKTLSNEAKRMNCLATITFIPDEEHGIYGLLCNSIETHRFIVLSAHNKSIEVKKFEETPHGISATEQLDAVTRHALKSVLPTNALNATWKVTSYKQNESSLDEFAIQRGEELIDFLKKAKEEIVEVTS